ncbi:MAG: RNA methyltransferase, partial [Myxococcales bacterium]|nr:RNA methyltransferase [Myxococcales bacterium]
GPAPRPPMNLAPSWFASKELALSRSRHPDPKAPKGRGRPRDRRAPVEVTGLRPHEHGVPGERAVVELLRAAPRRVRRLLVETGKTFDEVVTLAAAGGVSIEEVEREALEALVGPGLARGVLAIAEPPRRWDLADLLDREDGPRTRRGHRIIVALDGVLDPHNLGAVIRSVEFFGGSGVVWAQDRSAPLSPAAVRASAGASERLPLAQVTNLARAIEQVKAHGEGTWWVAGTVVDEGQPIHAFAEDPPSNLLLILGSEERGMRRLTRERCDFSLTIDRGGELGSLNVSAAAAVALALLA